MEPPWPDTPRPPPCTTPRRFQSMRMRDVSEAIVKVPAPPVRCWPAALKPASLPPSPVQVIERSPTEEPNEEPPTEALAKDVPPVSARPSKPRQKRSRPTASQMARVPKQPIRLLRAREALHAAARAEKATVRDPVLGGELIQQTEIARKPPPSLPRQAGDHEILLDGNRDPGGDHEVPEGNHVNGVGDNDNPVQLELDDGPSQDEGDQEGEDGQQSTSEGTRRHPKHKSTSKISKSRVRKKKKKKHGHELELIAEGSRRAPSEAEEESSDEEIPTAPSRIPSRPKRRKPENLHRLERSEFRIPKAYDTIPSPVSDGFVGKEAAPIGLVMSVRSSTRRINAQGKEKKNALRMGELVTGRNRHQDEKKLKKKHEKTQLQSKPQTISGTRPVGLEDDHILTATSFLWRQEQEDKDGFEIPEQIHEEKMVDSDNGAIEDHVPQISDNDDSYNGDHNGLLTPSTENTSSSDVPFVDPEQFQEADENILVPAEEPLMLDSNNLLESDHAMDEETTSIPFLEEATNYSAGQVGIVDDKDKTDTESDDNEVDMVDEECTNEADTNDNEAETESDDNEVDMIDQQDTNRAETNDNEVDMVNGEGRIEAGAGDGENAGVLGESSQEGLETYTEGSNIETRSNCNASDEPPVQNDYTSSKKPDTSDDEDEAHSGIPEQIRDSVEEEVAHDDVVTAVMIERYPNDNPNWDEEVDVHFERAPSEDFDSEEETSLSAAVPYKRVPTEDPESVEGFNLDNVATTIEVEQRLSQDTESDEGVNLTTTVFLKRVPTEDPDSVEEFIPDDVATGIEVEQSLSQETESDEEVDFATAVQLERDSTEDPNSDRENDFCDFAKTHSVGRCRSEDLDADGEVDFATALSPDRGSTEEVDLDDVAITGSVDRNPSEDLDSDEVLDLDDVAPTVAFERDPENTHMAPDALDQQDEIMIEEQFAEEETESPCDECSMFDEEPVVPFEQNLGGLEQKVPMDIDERDNETAEQAIDEGSQAERNGTFSEDTQTSTKVPPNGEGDDPMLLMGDFPTENCSLITEDLQLVSFLPKAANSNLEVDQSHLHDGSVLEDSTTDEHSSPVIENQRLEELPPEIPDSYPETKPNSYPNELILGDEVPEYSSLAIETPQLEADAYQRSQSNDLLGMQPPFLLKEEASEALLQPVVVGTYLQQAHVYEKTWQPRVLSQVGSMEIEDDQIVDSPPSHRYKVTRRKSSITRRQSLTLVRQRLSPDLEANTAGYSQGLASSIYSPSENLDTQNSLLSNISSEQTTARPIGTTPWSRGVDCEQVPKEANDLQSGMDIHSSRLDFVPDVVSYFPRASQDLHAPIRRSMTRSKSMFTSSSSRLASQNSSQASYNTETSQPISITPGRSFSRLPTLREGGEEPKILKKLTRKSSAGHGTTPTVGRKRMISLPFNPPFIKPQGSEGSVRR